MEHLLSCRPNGAVPDGPMPRSIGDGCESAAQQSDLHGPCAAGGSQEFFIPGDFSSHPIATCFVLALARHLHIYTCIWLRTRGITSKINELFELLRW